MSKSTIESTFTSHYHDPNCFIKAFRVDYPAPFRLGYAYIYEYIYGFAWEAFSSRIKENEGFVGSSESIRTYYSTRELAEFAAFAAIEDAVWGKA